MAMNSYEIDQCTSLHRTDLFVNENTIQNSKNTIDFEIVLIMHLNNYKVDTSTPSHHQVFVAKENTFQNFEKFVGFEMARSKRMNYQKICTSTPHISFIPSNIITEYDFRSGEFLIPITDVEV